MLIIGIGQSTQAVLNQLSDKKPIMLSRQPGQDTAEEIEAGFDELAMHALVKAQEEYDSFLLFIDSTSLDAAMTLRVVESLKTYNLPVNTVLFRNDASFATEDEKLMDRILFGVLQHKARSAMIDNLILVDVAKIEAMIADKVSIAEYEDTLYKQIASVIEMYIQITNNVPFYDSLNDAHETSKIMTLGIMDFDSGAETSFYDLTHPRNKRYYYLLTKDNMNKGGLLKKIRKQIVNHGEKVSTSFGIYETPFEENYVYFSTHSSFSWDGQEIE